MIRDLGSPSQRQPSSSIPTPIAQNALRTSRPRLRDRSRSFAVAMGSAASQSCSLVEQETQ
jgi:hypothetical protein